MKKNLLKVSLFIFLVLILLTPLASFAQVDEDEEFDSMYPGVRLQYEQQSQPCVVDGIGGLICQIHEILNSIIPVLVALGVVYFVWGVVRYFLSDSEEAKKKGKDHVVYGVIGLAVIVSLWGMVYILVQTFDLGGASAPTLVSMTGESSTCGLTGKPKFQDLLCYITRIINDSVIPLIFALATVFFVWGAVKFFIINSDEEAKRAQGKQFMIWGIVALAVMISVWGLVNILGATFDLETGFLPQVKPTSP